VTHSAAGVWPRLRYLPQIVAGDSASIARDIRRSWRVLWALTVIESRRKYAGSMLGTLWYPMYAALLLASYCFVYLVVLKMKYAEFGSYDYVLFVFAGLIPYLGLSEAIMTSAGSVRQSLGILKNAVFPIEFVPLKFVCAALFGLLSSLAILGLMILPTKYLGWHVLYLPIAVVMLLVFCVMVGWVLSGVAVFLPDVLQVINIALLLLMFLSPIGYPLEMVPAGARVLIYFNPLTYLIEAFRFAMLGIRFFPMWVDPVFMVVCFVGATLTGTFFRRLSPMFADYE
jgi:homopolymeric O-antigen transport system permease protein